MKIKPIAMAAISGLVLALAGMPAMADDSDASAGQLMQGGASSSADQSSTDNSQSQNSNTSGSSDTATGSSNTDEGNPDTPTGDDY